MKIKDLLDENFIKNIGNKLMGYSTITVDDIKKGAQFLLKTENGEIYYSIKSNADSRGYFDVRISSLTSGGTSFTKLSSKEILADFAKGKVKKS